MEDQAVVLTAAHESTRLLFVVGQPLCQKAHLTVSMSASQTNPTEILCQNQVPFFIQRLCAEVGTMVKHMEPLLPAFFSFTLIGDDGRRPVSPFPPPAFIWDLELPEFCGLEGLKELFGFVAWAAELMTLNISFGFPFFFSEFLRFSKLS